MRVILVGLPLTIAYLALFFRIRRDIWEELVTWWRSRQAG